MDVREEFEKSEHLKERLAICWYDEKIGCYLSIQLCDYASASYLNGAWYAFQEQQKKIDALKAKLDENHRPIHIDDLRTLVHWTEMMASEYGDDDAVEIALRVKSMIEDQK